MWLYHFVGNFTLYNFYSTLFPKKLNPEEIGSKKRFYGAFRTRRKPLQGRSSRLPLLNQSTLFTDDAKKKLLLPLKAQFCNKCATISMTINRSLAISVSCVFQYVSLVWWFDLALVVQCCSKCSLLLHSDCEIALIVTRLNSVKPLTVFIERPSCTQYLTLYAKVLAALTHLWKSCVTMV